MLCDDSIRHIAFMRNIFCFNGFYQAVIVLHYSAHTKPRKTIKTIKTENITDKHKMMLIVSSLWGQGQFEVEAKT